ncbi:MAG: MerR family DNA-binding transcriptional regulator [Rhodocyclales bacterium]|nr:MerR family DNA-binding transcriptional regulator [Rhodocyclales bacterium]
MNATRRQPVPAAAPSPDDGLYGITELAREYGISLRTIRFYEDKGLLAPRRINGGRAYTRRDRVRLGLILRGKAVGMSLAEIEHILSLYGEHGEGHAQQLDYLIGRIDTAMAELDERRRHIETMVAELGEVRGELRRERAARQRAEKKGVRAS